MFDTIKYKIDDIIFDLKYDKKELAKKAAKGAAIMAAESIIPNKKIKKTVKAVRHTAKAINKLRD